MTPPGDPASLLARYLAGETLTAPEWESLQQILTSSPEAMDVAVDQVVLDRLLRHAAVDAGSAAFAGEVTARLGSVRADGEGWSRGVIHHLSRRRWKPWLTAGAAAAAVALLGFWWLQSPPSAAAGQSVASITGVTSAVLLDGTAPQLGAPLPTGHHVRLKSGFASIKFRQGAEVILEGSADLEITGPNRATLHAGSAVARVPDSAHGFTIDGPGGKVVDLGTEFAVRATGRQMDVHVLEGSVEAHPEGQSMIPLGVNGAVRLTENGSAPSEASPLGFLTSLPPPRTTPASWLHWSFDEGMGSTVSASGSGFPTGPATGRLASLPGSTNLPAWTAGIRGTGLSLQGKNDFVQTSFPGISGSRPRTVACWVKVPHDLQPNEGFALVSWGPHDEPGDTWQVSINPWENDGPEGRLRVGTHLGHVVGITDLRDNQWHHVAAVLYGGQPANVATHVLLYVDGRLEPAAIKTVRSINTNTSSQDAQRVAFGKNSAIRSAWDQWNNAHTFRGMLDEITLCGAALNEAEIRHLMQTGAVLEP